MPSAILSLAGLLILCNGAIWHNRPQIASDCTIHEKSHNSQKNTNYSEINYKSTSFFESPAYICHF